MASLADGVVGGGVVEPLLPDPNRLEKNPPDFWVVVVGLLAGAGVVGTAT